jgi:hypothetical protein
MKTPYSPQISNVLNTNTIAVFFNTNNTLPTTTNIVDFKILEDDLHLVSYTVNFALGTMGTYYTTTIIIIVIIV